MNDDAAKPNRSEADEFLAFFDFAELAVLRTHTAIHRWATAVVAGRRGVPVSSLYRIPFLRAVREAHGEKMPAQLFSHLETLNHARNIVAHEQLTGEIFIKVACIGRSVIGPRYVNSPESVHDARSQFIEVLQFLESWATHP